MISISVDADIAEDLPFGFGHILVAGAHDHIHRLQVFHAVGKGRQGLDAPHAKNLVRTPGHHGVKRGRINPFTLDRRRAGHHPADPGNFGSDHGHMR
jgi:hypothetical protein